MTMIRLQFCFRVAARGVMSEARCIFDLKPCLRVVALTALATFLGFEV